jgi:hypothetical protein
MAALSYREQIVLAHELGGKYEMGYWKFPSDELASTFRRRVSGVEWSQEDRTKADKALQQYRKVLRDVPMEPEGK